MSDATRDTIHVNTKAQVVRRMNYLIPKPAIENREIFHCNLWLFCKNIKFQSLANNLRNFWMRISRETPKILATKTPYLLYIPSYKDGELFKILEYSVFKKYHFLQHRNLPNN